MTSLHLTIGVVDRLQVELLVFVEAGDVRLLLQVPGPVEHVLLRDIVGNHDRSCSPVRGSVERRARAELQGYQ